MKVLQVIPYFTPRKGGDVNVVYNISKYLHKKGWEVTILTTDFDFDEEYANSLKGVEVIPLKYFINISQLLISPALKKWLKINIKNYDVIHLHDFRSYQNIIVYKFSMQEKIPYIIHGHGSVARVGKKWLKLFYDILWGYKLLENASKLIAVSNEEFIHYQKMGADEKKIHIIYNGVDATFFHNNRQKGLFRKKYNLKNKIILYLGRIHETKGLDFLLHAFSSLSNKIKTTTIIVFIGTDEGYKKKLLLLAKKLHIENALYFIGSVDETEKKSAYYDADVFVNPARYMAGVALTTIEALLCNLPIITTNESGEVIQKSGGGYLVNYGDVIDLKNKLEIVLENPKKLQAMISEGKKYILQNLTWNKVIEQNIKIYNNIMEKTT